jgi:hypothetical protein
MNYYIDFDSTLYETARLSEDMLLALARKISLFLHRDESTIYDELKSMFNRENISYIYNLAKYFASKYGMDEKLLDEAVQAVIADGEKYVYLDSKDFLQKIKENGDTINILTYTVQEHMSYQLAKIEGSALSQYFDNVIICSTPKFDLDLKYEEGIFIDDNPRDLRGLYKKNPKRLIRIKRPENKYSKEEISDIDLEEYDALSKIKIVKS